MKYKLIKQGRFYMVYFNSYTADGEYHCKIKKKQKYWNSKKWRIDDIKKRGGDI